MKRIMCTKYLGINHFYHLYMCAPIKLAIIIILITDMDNNRYYKGFWAFDKEFDIFCFC